jgi:hypothetical protein
VGLVGEVSVGLVGEVSVGLVGEAGLERRFRQGPRVAQPAPGHVEAPHHRISVRAGPVDGVELAGELVAV